MNSNFHEFERDGWSQTSVVRGYEAGFGRLTIKVIPTMLEAVGAGHGVQLLDIATGPGYVAAAASERGCEVIGVDFAEKMIIGALSRHPEIDFRVGDALDLDFDDESFDAVTINFGLVHFSDPDLALRETFRVLRSGGRFATTVWAPPARSVGFSIALDAVAKHGDPHVPLPPGPSFFRFSEHDAFYAAMEGAGFQNIVVRQFIQDLDLESGDDLIAAYEDGTVRTGALLRKQPSDKIDAVHAAMRNACEAYRQPGGPILLPMPCLLAVGAKS